MLDMKPPFNDLNTVTEMIGLFKKRKSSTYLAMKYKVTKKEIIQVLKLFNVPVRGGNNNFGPHSKKEIPKVVFEPKGKYDYLLNEPINEGKTYSELLKEKGITIPKNTSFDPIRRFKKDSSK